MKFIGRFIFHIFSNAVAILIAANLVAGFVFNGNLTALTVAALALTVINTLVRPLVKLVLGPLLVLTFGFFIVVINAVSLFLVPHLLNALGFGSPLVIGGYLPLFFATFIISAVNLIVGFAAKMSYK